MNTVSYTDNASRVPVEGPGRFFLPLPSINLPLSGFSAESAGGLEPRGLQPYRHATTFHHLPPQVEGAQKNQPATTRVPEVPPPRPSTPSRRSGGVRATDLLTGDRMSLPADIAYRRDCLARHVLRHWRREEITEWLADPKHSEEYREDMRKRLNEQQKEIRRNERKPTAHP